jgi:hypothetical protein
LRCAFLQLTDGSCPSFHVSVETTNPVRWLRRTVDKLGDDERKRHGVDRVVHKLNVALDKVPVDLGLAVVGGAEASDAIRVQFKVLRAQLIV